ncbi:MAG: putative DNA binding domain-containing protein [Proteobacteria bacterium]|nr:putative DNA binding domain-containing protein [Pseudomonadota bacterium]
MNLNDLENLIEDGESEHVEFKKSTGQRTLAAKTVCAMSNGLGGFVIFGVTDKGEPIGQHVAAKTLEDITAELRKIEPPVFPDIETVSVKKDLSVIVLRVAGGGGPYVFNDTPYIRYGPTTTKMPRDIYEKKLITKFHATRRWENEPVPKGVTIDDLDEKEIQISLDNAIRLGRLDANTRQDTIRNQYFVV